MNDPTTSEGLSAFETAVAAQRDLERSLTGAGLELAEFPLLAADVDALGEPRIVLGTISTATAERLGRAIDGNTTATGCPAPER